MAQTLSCPSCGSGLTPPVAECPSCHVPLTGPVAVELWQTEQSLVALQNRRAELLTQLRVSAGPRHPDAAPKPVSGPGSGLAGEGVSGSAARRAGWTGQQVLLGTGALLLLTAAVVFVAVAWSLIGVAGQVAALGLLTLLAGVASFRLASRGLGATAETLAVIAVGLAVVDAAAAWELDLLGLQRLNGSGYGAGAAAVLALVFVALATRRPSARTFGLAGVAAAAVVPALALEAAVPPAAGTVGVSLVAAGGFWSLRRFLPLRLRGLSWPLALAAAGWLASVWVVAAAEVWFPSAGELDGVTALAGVLGLLGCAAGVVVSGLTRAEGVSATPRVLLGGGSLLVAALIVVGLAHAAGLVWLAVLVGVSASASALLCWSTRPLVRALSGPALVLAQLLVAGGLLALVSLAEVATRTPSWAALTLSLAFVCGSGAAVLLRRPGLLVGATAYTAGFGVLAAALLVYPSGGLWSTGVLTSVALALAVVAARQHGQVPEQVLAAVAVVAWLYAMVSTQRVPSGCAPGSASLPLDRCIGLGAFLLAAVLAVGGLAAFAYGLLPRRGWVSLLGVLACSGSIWTLAAEQDVTAIEAYSLPLAALLAVVGLVRLHREPHAPSWISVGPALSVALVPSALASLDDEGLARPLVVLVAGAAVLALGVYLHWQSPVLTGGVAVTLVAVSQLAPYAMGAPRWLSLGLVGVLLLAGGARYEQRRRNARQVVSWVGALH